MPVPSSTTFHQLKVLRGVGLTTPPEITSLLDISAAIDALDASTTFRGDAAMLDDLPKLTTDNVTKVIPKLALEIGARPHHAQASALVRERLAGDIRTYMQIAAPAWLDELRGMFEQLAAVVHAHAAEFPEPLTAPDAVFGAEATEHYRQLEAAVTTLDALRPARQVLAQLVGEGDVDVSMFIAPPESIELLTRAHMAFPSVGGNLWHRLVARGLKLRLNTPEEAQGIREATEQSDRNRQQQAAHRRRLEETDPTASRYFHAYASAVAGVAADADADEQVPA